MTQIKRITIDHLYLVVALGAALVCVLGLYLALYQPPPLQYSQRYYDPARPVYAPGETLSFTPTLQYRDWGAYTVRRTFNSRVTGTTAKLCDGTNAPPHDIPFTLAFEVVGVYREPNTGEKVPNLPPGDYWLIGSVVGRRAQYQVAFKIVQPC